MAAASAGKKMKKPLRARVTGGPGYVSEAAPSASAASGVAPGKRARVTGGPGGTAGTPGK